MALVTYPLNNIEYSAEDAELFHVTRTSGVYAKNSFDYSVTGADNTIVINTGIGWIKNSEFAGKVIALKERISLDMGLADSVYPRIDAVVIQFDANSNETNIIVKNGVASSEPIPPEVLRDESIYELHLYHVKREAGSLYITPGNITDLRINSSYCGLMADSVTEIDTSAIQKQISELVESLRNYVPPIESSDYPGCYYNVVNGEEEWVNPPMALGVEYRTADRHIGKAVYAKVIDCGKASNGASVSLGIDSIDKVCEFFAEAGNIISPFGLTTSAYYLSISCDGPKVYIYCGDSVVGKQVYVRIKYTKYAK